ncbi:MAG: hypothetical protein ABI776_07405 [Nocardioidaceae bacterium]
MKGGRHVTHLKRLVGVETARATFFASGVLAMTTSSPRTGSSSPLGPTYRCGPPWSSGAGHQRPQGFASRDGMRLIARLAG